MRRGERRAKIRGREFRAAQQDTGLPLQCAAGRGAAMQRNFYEILEDNPVTAAVKDEEGLRDCLTCDSRIIFILYGDICSIADIVERVHEAGKLAFVHLDLIVGLAPKEVAVDFIRRYTKADGIISTRPVLIKRARELGLFTVLRCFLLDSRAYENLDKLVSQAMPDVIEVLPAMMPKVIRRICSSVQRPVIAGGLVSEKSDVMALLEAGVISVSTTDRDVWAM